MHLINTSFQIKLGQGIQHRDQQIKVQGWVHRLRSQKGVMFIILRDGTGYMQCVLTGPLIQTYDALTLTLESTIEVRGTLKALPEGKSAPDMHELAADWWTCLGKAPGGDDAFTNKIAEVSQYRSAEIVTASDIRLSRAPTLPS